MTRSAAAGGNLDLETATAYATVGANTHLAAGDVAQQASNIATHEYALTAGYFTEYLPEIKRFSAPVRSAVFVPFAAVTLS